MTKEKKLYLTAGFLSIVSIFWGFIAFSIIIVCTPLHTLLLKGDSTHEYKDNRTEHQSEFPHS